MRLISVEEISSYKVLPFSLHNAHNEVILQKGEEITPGKLLKLKYITEIYAYDDEEKKKEEQRKSAKPDSGKSPSEEGSAGQKTRPPLSQGQYEQGQLRDTPDIDKQYEQGELRDTPDIDKQYEQGELRDTPDIDRQYEQGQLRDTPQLDKDDLYPYEMATYENETSCIPVKSQIEMKNIFKKAMDSAVKEGIAKSKEIYLDARDQIVEETLLNVDDIVYKSQLKVYGDYNYAHGVNVSILSTVLAYKLKLADAYIKDIALAAMLHDIGKLRIPKELLEKQALTSKESKLIQLHPQVGYRIIKREMGLAENIALVALEHHERNDGSGYPYGTSGELISLASQIVMVCDMYDNITSNRGHVKVKNSREAVKAMLDGGSKWFTPSILYTFVYMSNYNDTLPLAPHC